MGLLKISYRQLDCLIPLCVSCAAPAPRAVRQARLHSVHAGPAPSCDPSARASAARAARASDSLTLPLHPLLIGLGHGDTHKHVTNVPTRRAPEPSTTLPVRDFGRASGDSCRPPSRDPAPS